MSEHDKIRLGERRSRSRKWKKRRGSGFPRNKINKYEGTHLSMRNYATYWERRRWYNYSGYAAYMEGMVAKFVGKSVDALLRHVRSKVPAKYSITPNELVEYFITELYWKRPWRRHSWHCKYTIKDGTIQLDPEYKIHKYVSLTKKQVAHNDNIKMPNFGVCRSTQRRYRGGDLGKALRQYVDFEGVWSVKIPKTTKVGKVYVVFENHVLFVDGYIVPRLLYYEEYINTHWGDNRRIRQKIDKFRETYKVLPSSGQYQLRVVSTTNPAYIRYKRELEEKPEEAEEINKILENTSKYANVNVGIGKINICVKYSDLYEALQERGVDIERS